MYDCDPDEDRGVTEEEMVAFYADMDARPVELPTPDEVEAMARAAGFEVPF